jgi:hypothetical protein
MFAVIILTTGSNRHFAATATTCIAAVAQGLIGHAVVVADGNDSDAARIADSIGADVITRTNDHEKDIVAAARRARGEWLLILNAGDLPQDGWIGAIERHALATDRPAIIPVRGSGGWAGRMRAMTGFAKPGAGWALRRKDLIRWFDRVDQPAAKPPRTRPIILSVTRMQANG